MAIEVRLAVDDDAPAIAAIYAHHVATGTASYDFEAPEASFFARKIDEVTARGRPFIVAVSGGTVTGYACAAQMRDRAGYRYTCEDSVYVHPGWQRRGVGGALMSRLVLDAGRCGFKQMVAVIGGAEPASIALHARFGFVEVGRLRQVGYKFGRWLDSVYMQRAIGDDGLSLET